MANQNINLMNNEKMEEDEIYVLADKLMHSFVPPLVLNSIIEMGVLQIIHDAGSGGLSPTEIATRIQTQNPHAPVILDRMLRLLATYSVVTCKTSVSAVHGGIERRYMSSPMTKCFVPAGHDRLSFAPMLSLLTDKVSLLAWTKMKEAVFEGETPFHAMHGMHLYEYSSVDPKHNHIFNKGMYGQSTITMKRILDKYEGLNGIQQLVDVGGGHGHNIHLITSKYPSIKGINFDLPHVIQDSPQYPGVVHVDGDMFESIPKGDAIFLKWILHNWNDEQCLKLLRNCYKSLPENGKVIVVENIIPDEPNTSDHAKLVTIMDVIMITQISVNAKERTVKEFESLAKAAGFSILKLDVNISRFQVMEFCKGK